MSNIYPDERGCGCEDCLKIHKAKDCSYGQQDGPDDYITECDRDQE